MCVQGARTVSLRPSVLITRASVSSVGFPFRPKCLVYRLPADARLACDLCDPASARHVSQGCRDQSRVAVLEGSLEIFSHILRRLQMLDGVPGKCFKSHLFPSSPALWR